MSTTTFEEAIQSLRAELADRVTVSGPVVATDVFRVNGVELGVRIEQLSETCALVTDGSEAWSALWMSGLVDSRLRSVDRQRLERVADALGMTFDPATKSFRAVAELAQLGDAVKRIAVAVVTVDGWRFVLDPVSEHVQSATSDQVIRRVKAIARANEWKTEERAEVKLRGTDRTWTARATLARGRGQIALVSVSDDAHAAAPRVAAWVHNSLLPVVFIADARNIEATEKELEGADRARVVVRSRDADRTAREVVESAETLGDLFAA